MKPWFATALLLLLAVPHLQWWFDYEAARRGVLAVVCGLLCVFPGLVPRQIPRSVWAINVFALWFLVRSFGVTNQGYALEAASHYLALAILVIVGTGTAPRTVLAAAIPTGLVVALVTLAQSRGWLEPLPGVHGMTSTLGNLNTASEVLAVCGASAACLLGWQQRDDSTPGKPVVPRLALATVCLCAAAIWVNGSRSGLLALPIGCLFALVGSRRSGVMVIAALVAGLALGWVADARPGRPSQPAPATGTAKFEAGAKESPPSTVAVRLALWRGGLKMIADRPCLGHGAGQFGTEYPPYRTREELELSTFHRRFLAAPATTHNDYLQIMIEGGLPAALLFLAAVWLLLRRAPISHWGPLAAFGVLAAVRAPIGNAPTAALVFLYAGTLLGRFRRPDDGAFSLAPSRQIVKGMVFGGLMLWYGTGQFLSQTIGAGFLAEQERARHAQTEPDALVQLEAVDGALLFRPHDHNFRTLRAQAYLKSGGDWLNRARVDVVRLRRERPHDTLVHWLWVELLRSEGRNQDALKELEKLRIADPYDPKAILSTADILVEVRESPSAILILYANPQVRKQLASFLQGLAEFADRQGDRADAALLRMEQSFVTVLDLMIAKRRTAAQTHYTRFLKQLAIVDPQRRDPRSLILMAAQFLALDQRESADGLASLMGRRDPLSKTHAKLMEPVIAGLRDLPGWRAWLPVPKPNRPH